MRTMTSTAPTGTEKGRAARREARRLEAQQEMLMAQRRRRLRNRRSVVDQVRDAAERLKGVSQGTAISIMEALPVREQEIYVLAEEYLGPNREQVKRQFVKPRKETREEFLRGADLGSPEQADAVEAATEES